nr:immunoglobulin heavy chain junction region [Mus musculus]
CARRAYYSNWNYAMDYW